MAISASAAVRRQIAVKHHDDPVGKFEDFIEIFADQQHCRAAIAGFDDLGADLRRRGEIQSEAGIGGDEHFDCSDNSRARTAR